MAGLPGTGKTTLARELAMRCGGRVIGKDELRHAIFAEDEIEYSSCQDDFCMRIMLQIAGYFSLQERGRKIFLDGRPFSRRYQIENVIAASDSLHQPWRILECVCAEEVVRRRIVGQDKHPAGNRDFELYLEVKARFEVIALQKTAIDTAQALGKCVEHGLAALI